MTDEELHAILLALGDKVVDHYPSKITGVRHRNADGTARYRLVEELQPLDALILKHLPDNPVDPKAVGVFRSDGQHVGYLPERTAHDLLDRGTEPGCVWLALFRDWYAAPDGRHAAGALIEIVMYRETKDEDTKK
jgi:hypothetical protein